METPEVNVKVRVALLAAMLSCVAQAQPFARTIAADNAEQVVCVTWNKRTLTYRVHEAGSERTPGDSEFTAIDAAWAAWQELSHQCSDFEFVRGQRIASAATGRNTGDDNVVTFRDTFCFDVVEAEDACLETESCAADYNCWEHNSEGTIALTTVTFNTRTGVAVDADIEFNAARFLFTTISSPPCEEGGEAVSCVAYDIQNTATHEIGHVLGFNHVSDEGSTMAPTAPLGETGKRSLDPGTAEGFCSTYPKARPPPSCDERIQSRVWAESTSCASAPTPLWLLLLLQLFYQPRRAVDLLERLKNHR